MHSTVEARSPIEWIEAGPTQRVPRGAGKASKPVRVATGTLFGHSAGFRAISWQDVAGQKPVGAGGEPDALTEHVRFWEGPTVNWTWIDLVTPPEETGGEQGTQTVS